MKKKIIHGTDDNIFAPELRQYLALRKKLFVDQRGWNVPHDDEIERDQYDHSEAFYALLLDDDDNVVAGNRFLKTSCNKNGWSYMIRDAQKGRLGNIENHLIDTPSRDPMSYEVTRFTVDPDLSVGQRNRVLKELTAYCWEILVHMGANFVYTLMDPGFVKWFARVGILAEQIGPVLEEPTEKYCVIRSDVRAFAAAQAVA